ncbi:ATP-binding protein [Paenibacillus sp. EC2-1]|uniref:ATP-binding protein n=1 Tax=Paenibacillus sp. EC2-1 TaxID=3388665 RepID=UPI003BEED02F
MFETLLLNFLVLLFPVVIYIIFFENRPYTYCRKIIVLLAVMSMSLCMIMPIHLDSGFIFDLRYIPFIIVSLYGGHKYVFPLYVVLNILRFYVGGDGSIHSLLFSTVALLLIPLYHHRFMGLNSRNRILSACALSFLTMGCYLIAVSLIIKQMNQEFWLIATSAITTNIGAMLIIMILVERIITNFNNRERIIQSERLNVVSELAASVSHEIRNPLTVTNGFLQLLNKSDSLTDREKRFIELSLQELTRAEKIVSDYLSFAKPQSENMVYSNMSDELEYTKNIIMPYASIHDVEVEFTFNNSLSTYYDRNQMQQCLINLYKNGIEAMKESGGGTLSIEILESKRNIVIRICDTGVGMTKEELSRVGKPYYSTKEEGTGLGMLMVYSTINKLKGSIKVHSEKGEGTTFQLTIPAS